MDVNEYHAVLVGIILAAVGLALIYRAEEDDERDGDEDGDSGVHSGNYDDYPPRDDE